VTIASSCVGGENFVSSVQIRALISGSLSSRHGAISSCWWRTAFIMQGSCECIE